MRSHFPTRAALGLAALLFSCGVDQAATSEDDANAAEGAVTASPVRVVYAIDSEQRKGVLRALIDVANLGLKKNLTLHYRQAGQGWLDSVPARFVRSLPNNRELWVVEVTDPVSEFAVKYSVGGKVYWDNNGGKNYAFAPNTWNTPDLGTPVLAADKDLIVTDARECADAPTLELCVTVLTHELSVRQLVSVRYTTYVFAADAWKLVNQKVDGWYEGKSRDGKVQRWTVRLPLDNRACAAPTSLDFAAYVHAWYPTARDSWDKTSPSDFACNLFASPSVHGWRCVNGGTYDRRFAVPQDNRANGQVENYWPTGQ